MATQRQIPLDDQVVRHDRFDEGDRVLGLEPAAVDRLGQLVIKDAAVALASRRSEIGKCRANATPMIEDLLEVAVEEHRVASFVGDLGGEEDALILLRGGVQHRRQRVGDDLLTEEEEGHRRLERRLNWWWDAGPVALVALEIEVRHGPLLRLPAVVEGGAVVLRAEERVHLSLNVVHGHVHELVERSLLDSADGLEGRGVGHPAMLAAHGREFDRIWQRLYSSKSQRSRVTASKPTPICNISPSIEPWRSRRDVKNWTIVSGPAASMGAGTSASSLQAAPAAPLSA